MQQLCLTGSCAPLIAGRLFNALNVQPVGLRVGAFSVDGVPHGDALYLMPPPPLNGVPCRLLLTPERAVVLPQALEEVGAPGLMAAMRIQAPMLISGLSADLLACDALREAVRSCMMSARPLVVTADASAREALQSLLPPARQLWIDVPEDEAGQAALLEELIPEAALRF